MTTEQSSANIFEDIPCLQPHAARINEHLSDRPKASVRAHRERFEGFAEWAREIERQAAFGGCPGRVLQMPIEPRDLAAYARWMDEDGLALSTIRSYVSSIGALHVAAGFRNPVGSYEVRDALYELKERHADDKLQRARALTDDELHSILSVLHLPRRSRGMRRERPEEATKRANVDRAMLLSMIKAGMRRSEAADLTWGKVRRRENGSGMILLPINWDSNQNEIWIGVTERCMQALLETRPADADDGSNVFNLSSSQINRRLKRMCEEAGIDSAHISGNTPRATLHRILVEQKAPDASIKAKLRLK